MPKKITNITPEQTARFGEWRDKWIKIGLSTEPADFKAATEAALRAYDLCGLKHPSVIRYTGSPYAASVEGGKEFFNMYHKGEKESKIDSLIKEGFDNYRGGSFWASWGSYITFFRDVLGWENEYLSNFEIDEILIKTCGWVWWQRDILVISDRPRVINLDSEGRLHCENGPSIEYPDGWSMFSWHGVTVPKFVIENPETISVETIDKQTNAEVRRVMIDRYKHGEEIHGSPAFLRDSGGKRLDYDERFGTLWHREMRDDEPIVALEVVNSTPERDGSFKHYWLRVPPNITKAKDASAWTFNIDPKKYHPLIET